MTPERWRRIDELFRTVAEQPTAERGEYLTRVCGDDADLRREVLELLEGDGYVLASMIYAALQARADIPAQDAFAASANVGRYPAWYMLDYLRGKTADYDRWLGGMQKLYLRTQG